MDSKKKKIGNAVFLLVVFGAIQAIIFSFVLGRKKSQIVQPGESVAFALMNEGSQLKLEQSSEGVYQAGSYYECVRKTIEESLDNFLADTEFPYEAQSSGGRGQGGPREARDMQQMEVPDDGKLPDEALPEGDADAATEGEATPGNDMRSKGPLPNTGGDEPSQDTAAADQAGNQKCRKNCQERSFSRCKCLCCDSA